MTSETSHTWLAASDSVDASVRTQFPTYKVIDLIEWETLRCGAISVRRANG